MTTDPTPAHDPVDTDRVLAEIVALVEPQWRTIPVADIPDATVDAYRMGRNEVIDQVRAILGMPTMSVERTCSLCGDPVVWDKGNGGQWLGAVPPRDWMTCHGTPEGPVHVPVELSVNEELMDGFALGDQDPRERLAEALEVTAEWFIFNRENTGMDMMKAAHVKASEEAAELAEHPNDISEWADTVQCLVAAALQQQWSVEQLADALQSKNGINASRTWFQKPDGTWQHIPHPTTLD